MMTEVRELKQFDKFSFAGSKEIHCISRISNCQFTDKKLDKPVHGKQIRTQHGHIYTCYSNELVNKES